MDTFPRLVKYNGPIAIRNYFPGKYGVCSKYFREIKVGDIIVLLGGYTTYYRTKKYHYTPLKLILDGDLPISCIKWKRIDSLFPPLNEEHTLEI